jgi:hypothetical protein
MLLDLNKILQRGELQRLEMAAEAVAEPIAQAMGEPVGAGAGKRRK